MTLPTTPIPVVTTPGTQNARLDYLDATRAFALILGIVFHACLSFMPIFMGWAVQDVSTSPLVMSFMTISHAFRLELFFLLAGFLSHLTFHRKGAGEFVRSRLLRIGVPFVVGWFLLRPLVISGWIMGSASLRGDVDVGAGLWGGIQSFSTLPAGIFAGSHLWFLYYLALVTGLVLAGRGVLGVSRTGKHTVVSWVDTVVAWLADSPASLVIFALPTTAALWLMSSWSVDTPDKSLLPHFPALALYGGFFGFGWVLGRQPGLIYGFARLTPSRWISAVLGIAVILVLGGIERDPGHPQFVVAHAVYAFSYALTMWSLVFLTIGLFQRYGSRPNAFVRYVADSSYWMYLIHLPIVVWWQVAVAEWPFHWAPKLAFVSAATIGLSLLTYDLFVRSTVLGWVLNGRRRGRVLPTWIRRGIGRAR